MNLNSLNIKCAVQSTRIEFQWNAAAGQSGSECTYNVKVLDGTKMQNILELSTRNTRVSVDLEPNNSYMVAVESLINGRSISASAMHFKLGDLPIFCGEYCTTMAINEQMNTKLATSSFNVVDKIFDKPLASGPGHVFPAIGPSLNTVTMETDRKDRCYKDHVTSTLDSRDRRVEARDHDREGREKSRDRRLESRDQQDRTSYSNDRRHVTSPERRGTSPSYRRHVTPTAERRDHVTPSNDRRQYDESTERKLDHWRDDERYNDNDNDRVYARRRSHERENRRDEPETKTGEKNWRRKWSRERDFSNPSNERKHSDGTFVAEIGQADWPRDQDVERMMTMTSSAVTYPLTENSYALSAQNFPGLMIPPVVVTGVNPAGIIPPDFLVPQNFVPQNQPPIVFDQRQNNEELCYFDIDVQGSRDPYNRSRDLESSRRESREHKSSPSRNEAYRRTESYFRKSRDRDERARESMRRSHDRNFGDYDARRQSRDTDPERRSRDYEAADRRSRDHEPDRRSREYDRERQSRDYVRSITRDYKPSHWKASSDVDLQMIHSPSRDRKRHMGDKR